MKKRIIALLLIGGILACFAGCRNASAKGNSSAGAEDEEITTVMGQVTEISGKSITMSIIDQGDMKKAGRPEGYGKGGPGGPNDKGGPDGQSGNGTAPSAAPGGEAQSNSSGSSQTPSAKPSAGSADSPASSDMPAAPGGRMPGKLKLTGEEKTITLTDSTEITIDEKGKTTDGSIDDVKAGSVITVTLSGDAVKSVSIMKMGMQPGDNSKGVSSSKAGS